jgi:hypothetical protein
MRSSRSLPMSLPALQIEERRLREFVPRPHVRISGGSLRFGLFIFLMGAVVRLDFHV